MTHFSLMDDASTSAFLNREHLAHSAQSTASLIEASNINVRFGGHQVLRDVSLSVHPGRMILLQGPNGAGKSTLLNILSGNLPADSGTIRIAIPGKRELRCRFPLSLTENALGDPFSPWRFARSGVGRSWQDVRLFQSLTLADNLAVAHPDQPGESALSVFLRPATVRAAVNRANEHVASLLRKMPYDQLTGVHIGDEEIYAAPLSVDGFAVLERHRIKGDYKSKSIGNNSR